MKYLLIAILLLSPIVVYAQETIVKADAYSAEITTVSKRIVSLSQVKEELTNAQEDLERLNEELNATQSDIDRQKVVISNIENKIAEYAKQGIIEKQK